MRPLRGAQVEAARAPARSSLVTRAHLEDDVVLVRRRVDGGDLPRAVGVVERGLDLVGGDAEGGGLVAVDLHEDLRVGDLQVAGHIGEAGQRRASSPRSSARRA